MKIKFSYSVITKEGHCIPNVTESLPANTPKEKEQANARFLYLRNNKSYANIRYQKIADVYNSKLDLFEYRITPAQYIHIVCGKLEKDVLPPKTRIEFEENKPSQKQYEYLIAHGFQKIRGLTKPQASLLIHIVSKREDEGLASPRQLKALVNSQRISLKLMYNRYSQLRAETADEILFLRLK